MSLTLQNLCIDIFYPCSHLGHGINEHKMPVKSAKSLFQFCRWNILFKIKKEDITWW